MLCSGRSLTAVRIAAEPSRALHTSSLTWPSSTATGDGSWRQTCVFACSPISCAPQAMTVSRRLWILSRASVLDEIIAQRVFGAVVHCIGNRFVSYTLDGACTLVCREYALAKNLLGTRSFWDRKVAVGAAQSIGKSMSNLEETVILRYWKPKYYKQERGHWSTASKICCIARWFKIVESVDSDRAKKKEKGLRKKREQENS